MAQRTQVSVGAIDGASSCEVAARQVLKLGDTVLYYRKHGEEYECSPAIVVTLNDESFPPAIGLWGISHPIPNESYPLFWRPSVPFLDYEKLPTPADGSHFWTWR